MVITLLDSHSETGSKKPSVGPNRVSSAMNEVIEKINSTLDYSNTMENEHSILCPNCEEVYVERFYPCPICNHCEDDGNIALEKESDDFEIREQPIKNRKRSTKKSPEILYKELGLSVLNISKKDGKVFSLQISSSNKIYSFSITYDLVSNSIDNLHVDGIRIFKRNKSFPHYITDKDEFFTFRNFIMKFLKNHHNVN